MTGASVKLESVTKTFTNCTALKNISFSLDAGSCTLIGGANGSGKSVLMSIIAGLVRPDSGSVTVQNSDGSPAAAGLVFQEADAQILGETPMEDVMFGPLNIGLSRAQARAAALSALQAAGLAEKADYPARFLSGGEKRRLAVAGILALDRPLIIFDEPYANLDYDGVRQVNALITSLKQDGRTVIILTHELEKSLALCSRFIVLHKGDLVFDGLPEQGLRQQLEHWGIRNPLTAYHTAEDLVWL